MFCLGHILFVIEYATALFVRQLQLDLDVYKIQIQRELLHGLNNSHLYTSLFYHIQFLITHFCAQYLHNSSSF